MDRDNKFKTSTAFFYFIGATLMWCVDGWVSLSEGESFFNLSFDDFKLGLLVAGCGAVLWAASLLYSQRKPNNVSV
ncbi:MAG: hypothetical protein K6F05_07250 [Succinivibrio sp.]|nr:hypothetical protein [Succinivibrio sp.]